MIHDFNVLHRPTPHPFAGDLSNSEVDVIPVWTTCLRSLAFPSVATDVEILLSEKHGDQVFTQQLAYQFLLEVVCGLHSPILGETEVFGQFKIFAENWCSIEPRRAPLVQRILNDAKTIRTHYLSHLGTQSYGGWLRRNLRGSQLHILGGGHLTREILPYLSKDKQRASRKVVVHVRDVEKVEAELHNVKGVEFRALASRGYDAGSLVIAAPMTASAIQEWLGPLRPQQVYDLRGDSSDDCFTQLKPTAVLKDIFMELEATKSRLLPRLEKVRGQILLCSERAVERAMVRPQGWDDLCA